jgi:hypothetical protein
MPFFNGWRSGGTGIPPPFRTRFFIFHKIQRAKALTIGHVGCVHCPALFEPDTKMKSSVSSNAPVAIPPLVVAYAEATNSFDIERLMATFAEDASTSRLSFQTSVKAAAA